MSELIIGIDLGTTNSEVAIIENDHITILNCEADQQVLPSVVGLGDNDVLLVGSPARNQYALHPHRTIKSIKRQMGEDVRVSLGEKDYNPQEISAMILLQLKQVAEKHLGQPVGKAVITVPAYFSDGQRQATRDAGEIAGLEVVRIINEPTAAALAYHIDDQQDKKVLVYDLGGGTFDVSVVSLAQGVVEVLASHGNNYLGGDDFDQQIVDAIHRQLELQQTDISDDPQAVARIEKLAEQAKISLSSQPFVTIEAQFITANDHLSFEFSRDEYEQLINPFIDETLEAIHLALDGAQIASGDIDEVILVGGSSRTPLVHRRLKEVFAMVPRGDINPDLCVAQGAAIQAANIAGLSVNAVLVDITPYTFGTSALGDFEGVPYPHCYIPIIDKYTPLPVSKSEVFYTNYDGQEIVEINAFQGENFDATQNIKIGQFMIEGLDETAPAGSQIVVTLNIDINGILKVTAQEKSSGNSKSITIDNAISRFEGEHIEQARERVQSFFDAPVFDYGFEGSSEGSSEGNSEARTADNENQQDNGKLSAPYIDRGQALIEKAQRLLGAVNTDDMDDLIDMIEALKDALASHNINDFEEATEQLNDLIYFLES
ncbi:MAG: molecular chaperone DnaK [Phenylobacterium sp.]|jgi:molecular chaperone DnaK